MLVVARASVVLNTSALEVDHNKEVTDTVSRFPHEVVGRMMESLITEFIHNASLSCLATINVGAAMQNGGRLDLILPALLPTEPSCYPAVVGALREMTGFLSLIKALDEYYEKQFTARGLSILFSCENGFPEGSKELTALRISWEDVAFAARRALGEFESLHPGVCADLAPERFRRALAQICSGRTACIADFWSRELPAAGERRLVMRTRVNAHVCIERGDSLFRLLVTDVSHRGLGLKGLEGVEPGEHMRIIWKPGVAIAARVSWTKGPQFGVEIVDEAEVSHDFILYLLESTRWR